MCSCTSKSTTQRPTFLQPATNVFLAAQVDHAKWKTRNIDQNLQRNNVAPQVEGFCISSFAALRVLYSMWIYFTVTKFNESLGGSINTTPPLPPPPPHPQTEPGTCLLTWKMLARLIIRASFMRKAFVLVVCIRMYPYVSRMYPYVTRMLVVCQSYVFVCIRMFRMLLVCYSYVTRMYSCGVLVMIGLNIHEESDCSVLCCVIIF